MGTYLSPGTPLSKQRNSQKRKQTKIQPRGSVTANRKTKISYSKCYYENYFQTQYKSLCNYNILNCMKNRTIYSYSVCIKIA